MGDVMIQFNDSQVGFDRPVRVRWPCVLDDEVTRKLEMLIEGECDGLGPLAAARKHGYSKQAAISSSAICSRIRGAVGLISHKRGPKRTTVGQARLSGRSFAIGCWIPDRLSR